MALKVDLLDKGTKSTARIVLGIAFILLPSLWITARALNHEAIRLFDWVYSAVFGLNGVYYLIEGFGFSVAKLLGKEAFMLINDEFIQVKPDIWGREQTVYWRDIKLLDYKSNKFLVRKSDGGSTTIDLSTQTYVLKKEVKGAIILIAKAKGLLADDYAD